MIEASYDRLLQTALREIQPTIERMVERAFEGVPLGARELPVIGEAWPFECDDRAAQKEVVVRALCAREWFKAEGAPWAQPLLLKSSECRPLINRPHRRTTRQLPGLAAGTVRHARAIDVVAC